MRVVPLSPSALRVGAAVPFALRDAQGTLLLAAGGVVASEAMRQQLIARGVHVDVADSDAFQRAMAGKLNSLLHQNASLGQIARARIEVPGASAVPAPAPSAPPAVAPAAPRRPADPAAAWQHLLLRAGPLLRDPSPQDYVPKLQRLALDLRELLLSDPDVALLVLLQHATSQPPHYSVAHAVLVAVVCDLAARELPGLVDVTDVGTLASSNDVGTTTRDAASTDLPGLRPTAADDDTAPDGWRNELRCAALTMNLSMTALQDQLALQDGALTIRQRVQVEGHAQAAAAQLAGLGLSAERWLGAVTHHHDSPSGALEALPAPQRLARLIRRADIYLARLSPRRQRHALSATAGAQGIYLDESQRPDAAGAAIIKALGLYPPGSCVQLASGEQGVVLRRSARANAPRVASVVSRSGTPLGEPAVRDTRLPGHEIKASLAPKDLRVRVPVARLIALAG